MVVVPERHIKCKFVDAERQVVHQEYYLRYIDGSTVKSDAK